MFGARFVQGKLDDKELEDSFQCGEEQRAEEPLACIAKGSFLIHENQKGGACDHESIPWPQPETRGLAVVFFLRRITACDGSLVEVPAVLAEAFCAYTSGDMGHLLVGCAFTKSDCSGEGLCHPTSRRPPRDGLSGERICCAKVACEPRRVRHRENRTPIDLRVRLSKRPAT
jgi:hypothetical protein